MHDTAHQNDNATSRASAALSLAAIACWGWAAWWLMMASHEAGHVIAGLLTGGRIDAVKLSPIGFSQTVLSRNPMPLVVAWAGPLFGALDAGLAWALAVWMGRRGESVVLVKLVGCLAGFCLLANGVYIGVGWIDRVGDTHEMMRHGTPVWAMVGYGFLCCALGLAIWSTLGPWLGLKQLVKNAAKPLAFGSLAIVAIGFVIDAMLRVLL